MRVMGIDQSLTCTGVSILEYEDGEVNLLHVSQIETSTSDTLGKRLRTIGEEIVRLANEWQPDEFAREQGIVRHNNVTKKLFRVVGVLDYVLEPFLDGKDITEIPIRTAKRKVTGNGKAEKHEVEKAVLQYFGLEEDTFRTARGRLLDDQVDAIAMALTFLDSKGKISLERS